MGNGNRWVEIQKADGSTFSSDEARRLQIGQVVYLPVGSSSSPAVPPPAQPGQQRQYIIKPNDTLWTVAFRELGNGDRWREIKKADGSTFTDAEARNIQVGMSVYLPVSYPIGTGKPVTQPPQNNPAPVQSADFRRSLAFVSRWEGGYVNHPSDPGGATNKGIIQSTYNAYRASKGLPARDVRLIADQEVEDIYFTRYWKASGSDQLTSRLATVHFDTAVNMGVGAASGLLQQARQSANGDEMSVVRRYLDLREARYRAIVANKPSMGVFLQGWLNRLNSLRAEVGAGATGGSSPTQPNEGQEQNIIEGIAKFFTRLGNDTNFKVGKEVVTKTAENINFAVRTYLEDFSKPWSRVPFFFPEMKKWIESKSAQFASIMRDNLPKWLDNAMSSAMKKASQITGTIVGNT